MTYSKIGKEERTLRQATIRLAHENPALRPHLLHLLKQARYFKRYEVIESRSWVNRVTGQTASIYGASPWTSLSEKNQWDIMSNGWTVRDNVRGTVGIGREPWKSRQEAEKWVEDEDRKRITRAIKVTIESMEMDLNRLPNEPIDGGPYIKNLEAHADEVASLNPTVARSIRVTMGDMKVDMARRGEVGLVALGYYVENLKEDLKRL